MKILMVSSFLPYPLLSGGNIRLYNLLKFLNRNHEITLICEKRDFQNDSDIKRVEEVCKRVFTVPRKKQWSFGNVLKASFSLRAFLTVGHTSQAMKNKISELLSSEKFDLIHVETFYVIQNVPKSDVPIVLAEHNLEYLIYKRYAQNVFPLFRVPLYLDVFKLKREEEKAWDRAKVLIAVSQKEKELMERVGVEVVPNGADIKKFKLKKFQRGKLRKVLFIGDFKYIQNIDVASFVIKKIWPLVLEKDRSALLWIVGKDASRKLSNIRSDSVIFEDNPTTNTEDIYQEADILLAPIRVGGGTSLKILEAMASGLAVVTTPLGNEGIGAKENDEILVAHEPWEFAEKISELLTSEDRLSEIGIRARRFIEKNYEWEKIAEKLDEAYEKAIL